MGAIPGLRPRDGWSVIAPVNIKFTTLDGLAENSVHAIAEDGSGRWWFGTDYDGASVLNDGGTLL